MEINALNEILAVTPVREFRYFDSIGSTNDEALQWCDAGAADFSLVIAEEQTKGRGRFERRWVTHRGCALAFSLILQPSQEEKTRLAIFAPLCGLALRDTIETQLGLQAEIKWPNDVLLDRRKTAGILVEANWSGDKMSGIVLGIGINISRGSIPPVDSLQFPATCLENHCSNSVDRYLLLQGILNAIAAWRAELGSPAFFEAWQRNLAFKGEVVRIEDSQKTSIIGRVKGIDTRGHLVLTLDNGTEKDFEAGDVHLRPVETKSTGGA
jgi:BirA family biotin operon repressor/biotin-[acetyl-CoA-carboxylase] ligase